MMGLGGVRPDDDPLGKILELFDDAGYIGVVATNCEQTYHRYLRPGEDVSVAAELTDVVGPKRTALGEAFFITQTITWSVGDEDVAEMMWRIMKFIPRTKRLRPRARRHRCPTTSTPTPRCGRRRRRTPSSSGTASTRTSCASRSAPTAPCSTRRCPRCGSTRNRRPTTSSHPATGTVFSFVVHHAPKVPGRTLPFVIALVELDEGVRMLGELRNVDPASVEIGMPVRATYIDFPANDVGPAWTNYAWEPQA